MDQAYEALGILETLMQITLCGLRLEVLSQARAKIISKDGKFGLAPTPEKM